MKLGTSPGICEQKSLQVPPMTESVEAKARVCLSALTNEVPELQDRVWVSCPVCCDLTDDWHHMNLPAPVA